MQNELNEYLKEKGVSNDIRNKRMLATAFGLIFDASTTEQESALLLALKVGGMATGKNVIESFRVDVAFDEQASQYFNAFELAKNYSDSMHDKCKATRISKTISISQIIE